MFMDDSLNINPSMLNDSMEHQMNLFSMTHENQYGELMNELIEIFIPPEGASPEELEEAKRNMENIRIIVPIYLLIWNRLLMEKKS